MFSKNNTKMNDKKQFEKVNHYGIKKFNAGTASVLIASAFMFLGGAAQAADTNKEEATVATTEKVATEKPTEEKAEVKPAVSEKAVETKEVAPKAEVKEETTVKEATKEEKVAKEVNKTALQAKISQLDNLFVSLAGKELSADKQVKTVSAAVELNKAKDLVASASATQEQVDAQVAALEAAINNLNTAEKATDKKEEVKKEEKSETKVAKENLEKVVSEAKAVNQAAKTFETKQVKEEAKKAEIKAAVATSEKEIAKALDIFNSDSSTKEDADQQRKELEKAIEAVYVTMQRAGHRGKVESVLADSDTKAQTITGKDIVHKGNAVVNVKNAYISMNDKDTAPTAWGIDLVFDTSKVEAGDTTTISLSNLADFGASFKSGTEIVADDGKVIGKVTAVDWKTSTGNRGTDIPYFAQRQKNGMTYDERVAEQPAIANETGTVTYVIEWNELAKNYAVTTYSAANLTGSGYLAPAVSEDTPYKATIKVDGQTVVEHTYTHPATKPDTNKYGTMASLLTGNGMKYKGAERIGKNDSLNIQTDDDISYGKGSTFTVKLPSDEFTYFKKLNSGSDTVSDTDATYRPTNRWSNVKANENKVWILNDGRDSHFKLKVTLKSPTEIVAEVIEGEIEPGSTVAFDLAKVGIEKVVTDRTFADDYSKIVYNELGHVKDGSTIGNDKTAATLTVTGGKSVNGQPENVTTKVNNGWVVASSIADSSAAETGAVVLKLTDLETGKVIGYEPTEYNGEAKIKDDGTYETKNILGKKYDVTAQVPELVKKVNDTDYILVDLPPKGPTGTISISDKRVRDVYTAEEIKNLGLNPNAYLTNVIYSYVKKTKVEEVNRTIKFVYADDVKDLAGTEVFPSQKQTVSYTGTIKKNGEGKAEVDENDKPIYINWKGNGDTNLPEVTVPQKEGYIASVEKVPVQPTTAKDEDYEYVVKYAAIQKAKTTFVDEKGNPIPGVEAITEEGGPETPLTKEAEVKAKIKELENKGYELVSNTYPEGGKFDKDANTDQEFKVTLKERVVPVTPDQPKTPGTPVDPNNPDGPKYPAGLEEKNLNKTVTRTITYVYEDGTPVLNEDGTPKTVTQEAKFTREAKVNLVTGEVTYGDWSEAKDLPEVKSPVVKGYLADKATVPATKVTADSENTKEVVTYKPIGSWIPNIPGQPTNPIKYPNDPTDPTKPGQPTETLPYVPGFTPEDKDGNPLKPVDPQDPTKGYVVPNIPTDPSQDTVINYVANKAKLVVKYVDENGKELLPTETKEGKVGDDYSTSGKVITGYVLDRVEGEAKGKIGTDGTTVTYVYKPLGSWIPNIPGQPTNPIKYPNDPTDPTKPGQPTETLPYVPGYTPKDGNGQPLKPVDPQDPTKGYVVPNIPTDPSQDTVINYEANKAKLVVKYVDENGKDLIPSETTEGKVGDEYTTTGKVIPGHLLVRVDGDAKGKIGTEGSTVTYVYKPIGSWIPNIPGQPTNPIKYPNDPQDPTKPGSDKPVLPYVPGHTPVDGNGNPLKPVDPTDPSKGYISPDIPTNPGEDTPINYIPNVTPNGDQDGYTPQPKPQPEQVVTYYVDENGKDIAPSEKGAQAPKGISGYEYVTTTKDPNGNLVHHYKKVATPQPVPSTPETPEQPVAPVQPEQPTNPNQPAVPAPAETSVATDSATQPATPKYVDGQKELPNTGTEANASLAALGLLGALGGFGLLARKKKED